MIRGPIAGGWNWVDAGEVEGGILVARETCDEGEKTSLGCGDDFGCFRLILVVLEYAFQLISVWAMAEAGTEVSGGQ
jgi:hypothetical protein